MTAVLTAQALGKRYGRNWALSDCDLEIPAGQITALVGPNGAGKSTLIHLAVGLMAPTTGRLTVLGGPVAGHADAMARIGFVAQDAPLYSRMSVADHLRLGAHLNPGWDARLASDRVAQLELEPSRVAGRLSGGQRAQLALTLAMAKRPELLILDEPVASLDPLARRELMQNLMAYVAEYGVTVIFSSHLIGDLERVCDYLVALVRSKVAVAGEVDELLASHRRITGPRTRVELLPATTTVVEAHHTDRQSTLVVRQDGPVHDPAWTVDEVTVEDLVLAYIGQAVAHGPRSLSAVSS